MAVNLFGNNNDPVASGHASPEASYVRYSIGATDRVRLTFRHFSPPQYAMRTRSLPISSA